MARPPSSALGKQLGLHLIKQAQVHPIEHQRRAAQFNLGQRELLDEFGYEQGSEGQMSALADSDDYYRRIRELYDQIHTARTGALQTAGEKETKVLSIPQ